jgi:hypothetical protein
MSTAPSILSLLKALQNVGEGSARLGVSLVDGIV